jgi:hypothetical protein
MIKWNLSQRCKEVLTHANEFFKRAKTMGLSTNHVVDKFNNLQF